jgi:hypothetical protein
MLFLLSFNQKFEGVSLSSDFVDFLVEQSKNLTELILNLRFLLGHHDFILSLIQGIQTG